MSGRKRGSGFDTDELTSLLETIASILPIAPEEWSHVEQRHLTNFPHSERRKFQQLYRKKQPTNLLCPLEIRKAKRVHTEITELSDDESSADTQEAPTVATNAQVPTLTMPPLPQSASTTAITRGFFRSSPKISWRQPLNRDEFSFQDFMRFTMVQSEADSAERAEARGLSFNNFRKCS